MGAEPARSHVSANVTCLNRKSLGTTPVVQVLSRNHGTGLLPGDFFIFIFINATHTKLVMFSLSRRSQPEAVV